MGLAAPPGGLTYAGVAAPCPPKRKVCLMSIRAVLFDKDGTLIDFRATWLPTYEGLAREVAGGDAALALRLLTEGGYSPDTGAIDPASPLAAGTNDQIAALWGGVAGIADTKSLATWLDARFRAHGATGLAPVTDLAALFGRLRARGLALGVATNDSEQALHGQVPTLGLNGLVDFLAGYDSGHGHKPEPGMVHAFCRATGVPVEAVAVVGDSLHDLEMGRRAGAGMLVGVLTGASGREHLSSHAHHILASIAEIESILN